MGLMAMSAAHAGPARRALVVVIGDYPAASGWGDINSDNDEALVVSALNRQGFRGKNIAVLRNGDADRSAIEAAFREHLIEASRPGDIAWFHYSGHGHQIPDDNGEEWDGYDESLVAWGAPAEAAEGYAGELHVRDDDLGEWVTALRRRLGPEGSLLVTMDSCYSGSSTRGPNGLPTRGRAKALGPPAERAGGLSEEAGHVSSDIGDDGDLAPWAVLSATASNELDQEVENPGEAGQVVGPLSLALAKVMPRARQDTTHRALYELIRAEMAKHVWRQTPQLEGHADALLFKGEAVAQEAFFSVARVRSGRPLLLGGSLHGLGVGATVDFHASGTTDPSLATPFATGRVVESDAVNAWVELEEAVSKRALEVSWAFVNDRVFAELPLLVELAESVPEPLRSEVVEALAGRVIYEAVKTGADVRVQAVDGQVSIWSVDDDTLVAGPIEGSEVLEALKRLAKSTYLKRLQLDDPEISVQMELLEGGTVVDDEGKPGCATPDSSKDRAPWSPDTLAPGAIYNILVHNTGKRDAWVSILDITPDGHVGLLYPPPNQRASDAKLLAGESQVVPYCFQIDPTPGREVIKLFATRNAVDFAAAKTRDGEAGPLDRLLVDVMRDRDVGTRAGTSLPASVGSVHSVTFLVAPDP